MRLLSLPILFLTLSAAPAAAQSINVDFQPVNAPNGPPPASYGAAAQSSGVWNAVASDSAANLVAANGTPTTVGLATTALVPTFFDSYDYANTFGADQALLDDYHRPDDYNFSWIFTGLAAGEYDVYTIQVQHNNGLWVEITVPGSPDGTRNLFGDWIGAYVEGNNYVKHHVTVASGTVSIDIHVVGLPDYAYLSGIQLVTNDRVGLQQCFGDGSATSCPCGNNGLSGHGCGNSANSSGALLVASGTTSPDTIVLHSFGETATALSVFLQGDATVGPIIYGDGLRCAGGILKRLYIKSASAGSVSAPGPGDPSITARSAALGNPIPPGDRRYYQVYFRDASPGFCPPPQGSTFNITNAVKLIW